ncbi:hypothetical protein BGZ73_004437, partial [Actinomortierella ambigua]
LRSLFIDVHGPGIVFQEEADGAPQPSMPMLEELVMFQRSEKSVAKFALWPVLCLPRLKRLWLVGRAAAEFNPSSLVSMTSLTTLHLDLRPLDWRRCWDRFLWTWDLHLPCLTDLELVGPVATAFNFHALEHLPALTKLTLESAGVTDALVVPEYPERFTQGHGGPFDNTNAQKDGNGPVSRPGASVRVLHLRGYWCIDDEEWRLLLLRWLPNLEELHCLDHHPIDVLVAMEWMRRHPQIRRWISVPNDNLSPELDLAIRTKTMGGRSGKKPQPPCDPLSVGREYLLLSVNRATYQIGKLQPSSVDSE